MSPATRFDASEVNATYRPSAENAGWTLSLLAWAPPAPTETRRVTCLLRSRTNTSPAPLVSPATRFDAHE